MNRTKRESDREKTINDEIKQKKYELTQIESDRRENT